MRLTAEVVNLVISENTPNTFSARRTAQILKKKVVKLAKEGRLTTNFLKNDDKDQWEWAYRIFSANTMLGDYSWWGWETRSGWAWQLANNRWFYPRWDGKHCKLLVLGEQGIGDEILFISCARELAQQAEVHWEVDSRMIPILQRSIPEVTWISRWKDDLIREPYQLSDHRGEYDAFIPAGNVPKLYRTSKHSFPRTTYLVPDQDRIHAWKKQISGVGFINKAGFSLEKRADVPGDHDLHHHSALYRGCKDFDDFVALVNAMDYINAVPSAVVHICGATGQRCNVIKPERVLGAQNTILKYPYGVMGTRKMDWYGDHIAIFDSVHDYHSRARAVA